MKKRHKLIVILIIFVVVVLGIVTKQRANKRERFQQVQIMFENQVISEMEEKCVKYMMMLSAIGRMHKRSIKQ